MSKGRLFLLPFLAVLFVVGACQSEGKLKGEVFIVTEGRSNVELGDIEVKAIRSSKWERHLREKHQRAEELVSNKVKRLKPLMDSLEAVRGELEKAERELRQVRYEQERLDRPEILSSDADEMPGAEEVNRLYTISEAEMTDIPFGDLVQEVDSGLFVEPIEKGKRQYKVRLSNSEGWIHALNIVTEEKYRDFLDSKKEYSSRRDSIRKEISYKKEKYRRYNKECESIEEAIKSYSNEVENFRRLDYYFGDVPSAEDSDRTGSEGRFELSLRQGVSYYVIAHASRSILGSKEKYFWMVEKMLEDEGGEVILSNNNMDRTLPDSLDVMGNASAEIKRLTEVKSCE